MGMVFFVLGLVFGSFINVLIWRIPRRESIVFPGSHCPDCGKTLSARELIPVVSYLIQKGKCIHCGRRISWQYPAVELITAVGFAFYQWREPSWAALVSKLILFSLLIVAAAIDLRHKKAAECDYNSRNGAWYDTRICRLVGPYWVELAGVNGERRPIDGNCAANQRNGYGRRQACSVDWRLYRALAGFSFDFHRKLSGSCGWLYLPFDHQTGAQDSDSFRTFLSLWGVDWV